jgi:hypothetical protein
MQPNWQLRIPEGSLEIKEYFHVKQQLFENLLKLVSQSSTSLSKGYVSSRSILDFPNPHSLIENRYLILRENRLEK